MPAWSAPGAVAQAPAPLIGSKAAPAWSLTSGAIVFACGVREPDLARGELGPRRSLEREVGVGVVEGAGGAAGRAAAGLGQRLHALERRRALALDVVVEPGVLLADAEGGVGDLVLPARVAVVGEDQRDRRAVAGARAVVEADRLVGREQVVRPAVA